MKKKAALKEKGFNETQKEELVEIVSSVVIKRFEEQDIMLERSFQGVQQQIFEVKKDVSQLNSKVSHVETNIGYIETKVDGINNRLDDVILQK